MHKSAILLVLGGVFAGLVNGILGGGAGVVVVMLLLIVSKLTQTQAQATALLVVLPMTILSSILYIINGSLPAGDTIVVAVFSIVGGVVGATLLGSIDSRVIKGIFSLLLLAGGVQMIVGAL